MGLSLQEITWSRIATTEIYQTPLRIKRTFSFSPTLSPRVSSYSIYQFPVSKIGNKAKIFRNISPFVQNIVTQSSILRVNRAAHSEPSTMEQNILFRQLGSAYNDFSTPETKQHKVEYFKIFSLEHMNKN